MLADELDYVIGVDPHRDTHALAVVDVRSGGVVFEATAVADGEGYESVLRLANQHALGRRAFELAGRAEAASKANRDFPCQFNWRSVLVCALAFSRLGDEREACRLEEMGRTGAVVAGPAELEPALLRLAVVRANDQAARRILETLPARGGPWSRSRSWRRRVHVRSCMKTPTRRQSTGSRRRNRARRCRPAGRRCRTAPPSFR